MFKVGDRVRVVGNDSSGEEFEYYEKYVGSIGTVGEQCTMYRHNYIIYFDRDDLIYDVFTGNELELVEDKDV